MIRRIRIRSFPLISLLHKGVSLILLILSLGCTTISQYNSKDLNILPCESNHRFFYPIEFDHSGQAVFQDQLEFLVKRLKEKELSEVYVFVHGWDKTSQIAEREYQDLICRFFSRGISQENYVQRQFLMVGVFWPSTILANYSDPEILKWATYYVIRNRADHLGNNGFKELLEVFRKATLEVQGRKIKLVLIGHSFGGRALISGLLEYLNDLGKEGYDFLMSLESIKIILLNAAFSQNDLWRWPRQWRPLPNAKPSEGYMEQLINWPFFGVRLVWTPTLFELSSSLDAWVFNVYSERDWTIRFLYPLGSVFSSDSISCGIGSCGIEVYRTLRVNDAGKLIDSPDFKVGNIWNVDASEIITSHTDIYKGRVSNLLLELVSASRQIVSKEEIGLPPKHPPGRVFGTWLDSFAVEENSREFVNSLRLAKQNNPRLWNEFALTAFQVDFALVNLDWKTAERNLRKLIKLGESGVWDLGWSLQLSVLKPRHFLFWDWFGGEVHQHSSIGLQQLHFALGIVLVQQGKLSEGEKELREILKYKGELNPERYEHQPELYKKILDSVSERNSPK